MGSGSQIRQFEWSTTEFCSLPARSAGLSSQVRDVQCGTTAERRVPASWARSRDTRTEQPSRLDL